ncbi:hypothetical protein BB561_000769 [Smittium simulii]|uniref:Peptidase S1 domain-containing protein n=1 Tax=Smittium simulii TaxID=133385 RepID=A0A2T9YXL9_9FUNG|nr:hypothetical protein BB561_000769 [Smittium simulii]
MKTITIFAIIAVSAPVFSQHLNRIIGGESVRPNVYPSVAYIADSSTSTICSGSLIAGGWILTAAHCLYGGSAKDTTVTISDSVIGNNPKLSIESYFIHKDYEPRSQKNDIAVIKLTQRAVGTHAKISSVRITDNMRLRAFGWGARNNSELVASTSLQTVLLETAPSSECKKNYPLFEGNGIGNQICTGKTPGNDTCLGDSGGPLMVLEDGTWKLAGITSFGAWPEGSKSSGLCGSDDVVGIYTNVNKYMAFLTTSTNATSQSFL